MSERIEPGPLWLGACVGAQVLLVLLGVINANVYRERAFLLHAAATLMAVVAVQALLGTNPVLPNAVLLLVPALAGLQLVDLMSHAGGLGQARRALLAVSAAVLPLLAALTLYLPWALALGSLLWTAAVAVLLWRAWRQSVPWVWWLLPGLGALAVASWHVALDTPPYDLADALLLAAMLTLWSATVYLATGWRGRLLGETRARIAASSTIDPLTGLATPLVLAERVQAARHLARRYGHPSVLMVIHIDNLHALAGEFGLEAAEAAVLAAANRVRESLLRDGDVAARLAHARFGVLAEGVAPGQHAATVAGRILVAGLKEPLAAVPAEFLRFRIVLAPVPGVDIAPRVLLERMNARLDAEVKTASERRIVTLAPEELLDEEPPRIPTA